MSVHAISRILRGLILASYLAIVGFQADAAAAEQRVYFRNLKDGQECTSPVLVQMGAEGVVVEPAGPIAEGRGHHHLLLNGSPIAQGVVIPTDEKHLHFGNGQTEATIELPPGEHKLTLQFADGAHRSYGEELSATVSIKVK